MASQYTIPGYLRHVLEVDVDARKVLLECYWKLNEHLPSIEEQVPKVDQEVSFATLNLFFAPSPIFPHGKDSDRVNDIPCFAFPESLEDPRSKISLFLQDVIRKHVALYGSSITALKLLLPKVNGYVCRGDIIQRRFLTCDLAEKAADFTTVRQQIRAFDFKGENILQRALCGAVGAVVLKRLPGIDQSLVTSALDLLDHEMLYRLSLTWILDAPLPRKRLAMVEGRPSPAVSAASMGIYRAASALGIDLVVLDHDGHWVQDPAMESLRAEFIACDITIDEGLPDRIVQAVSKSKEPIDAIVTFPDAYLLSTARAAKKLGLHTNPPVALEMCRDKRKTREIASADVQVLSVTGVADLKQQLPLFVDLIKYPLIVKPTMGCSSEGVSKVTCETELIDAVSRNEEQFPGVNSLIEPYVSGPEVDANFVLLDGKLIWSEINDDFPSSAEMQLSNDIPDENSASTSSSSSSKSFAESSTIIPSILPGNEIALLKASLAETLVKLGFRNGVYHLEARVKDSKSNYAMTTTGVELVESPQSPNATREPSVFLIEINARVPGHQETFAVEYTYGIDYFALSMLMALSSDKNSGSKSVDNTALESVIHTLSQPYSAHVQYPTNIVFIPAERGGTFMYAKPLPEDLMRHVVEYTVFIQKGEVIKDPEKEGKWPFVAYFLVVGSLTGREGREQVRRIGERIRKAFEYEMKALE
ncbi:hypothetical protein EYC84_006107 [Monilinia fructicola]|uniref:ATP-grasp domain-containing protein n=1 Tax=Monilinia fructicola TaxID=38448 RepID=A0A5M9K7A6_MONFR|nr:hypothetical protein EYC84_006107 [Monilinia fructicola]